MRQNGCVPRVFTPPTERPPLVDAAVDVLGSSARLEMLRFLAENPGSHFGRLAEGLPGMGRTSLVRHLRALEDAGVVELDLAPEERKGRSPRYTLVPSRLEALTKAWTAYVTKGAAQ